MRCKRIRDLISPYLDNMTDEKENLLVEEHLSVCMSCLETANKIKSLRTALLGLDCPLPRRGFAEEVMRRLQEEHRPPDKSWPGISSQVRALLARGMGGKAKGELIRFYRWGKKTLE